MRREYERRAGLVVVTARGESPMYRVLVTGSAGAVGRLVAVNQGSSSLVPPPIRAVEELLARMALEDKGGAGLPATLARGAGRFAIFVGADSTAVLEAELVLE